MVQDSLRRLLEEGGSPIDPDAMERILQHHDLLLTWNRTAHLVSAGDASLEALTRHDLEAAQALPHLADHDELVDVGSGGGYPGFIWACCRPDLTVTLVEANLRKAAFLREAARRLQLPGVRIEHQRCATAIQLVALGGDLWTTRAAGCSELLLTAGEDVEAGSPTLILYSGTDRADRLTGGEYPGWICSVDEPLVSGATGRLQVVRRA
jgi:16S rRNA (guanine(527)-N(7))-methyltransferase RsmG